MKIIKKEEEKYKNLILKFGKWLENNYYKPSTFKEDIWDKWKKLMKKVTE